MRIGEIQVTLTPWIPFREHTELRIKVQYNGTTTQMVKILLPDDFESCFDTYMRIVTEEIKAAVKEEV